ncbi:hypothetical protein TNCT_319771, partial [Trichonephila clavata]
VKPSSQNSEDVTENDELIPAITCQHEACEISQSIEQLSPSVSGHVSNIHPGGFCNQTTAQLCRLIKLHHS